MKLWMIDAIHGPTTSGHFCFVVRAETHQKARKIAASKASGLPIELVRWHDKACRPWVDAALSKCSELRADGKAKVVIEISDA